MPSRPSISIDLFDRYRAGECTPSEAELVRAALADDPALAALEQSLSRASQPDSPSVASSDAEADAKADVKADASWARFLDSYWGTEVRGAMQASAEGSRPSEPARVRGEATEPRVGRRLKVGTSREHGLWPRLLAMPRAALVGATGLAAGVAAAALAVIGVQMYRAHTQGNAVRTVAEAHWSREYTTATGERAIVMLRDGSRVTLAPHSWLGVARDFGGDSRVVALRGEALFEVVGASRTPFLVRTGSVTTQVLGTTFDVRRYEGDRTVQVVVKTGRVRVAATSASGVTPSAAATVAAGMAAFATDSSVDARADRDPTQFGAWANGQLVFRDAPLPDVLAALTRWYGYRFQLADSSFAHTNLNMRVSVGAPDDALATLTQLLDAKLTMRDSTILLSPRRGALARPKARGERSLITPMSEVGR